MYNKRTFKQYICFLVVVLLSTLVACEKTPDHMIVDGIEKAVPKSYGSIPINQKQESDEGSITSMVKGDTSTLRGHLLQDCSETEYITRVLENGEVQLLFDAELELPDTNKLYTGRMTVKEPDIEAVKQALWGDREEYIYYDEKRTQWCLRDEQNLVEELDYSESFNINNNIRFEYYNHFLYRSYISYDLGLKVKESEVFTEQQAETVIYDFLGKLINVNPMDYHVVSFKKSVVNEGTDVKFYLQLGFILDGIPFDLSHLPILFVQGQYTPAISATVTRDGVISCSGDMFLKIEQQIDIQTLPTLGQILNSLEDCLGETLHPTTSTTITKIKCIYFSKGKKTTPDYGIITSLTIGDQVDVYPGLVFETETGRRVLCFRLDTGEFIQ